MSNCEGFTHTAHPFAAPPRGYGEQLSFAALPIGKLGQKPRKWPIKATQATKAGKA
jgi:hypothetical protein